MEMIISEATFDKLKAMALDIHNLALVYRNYLYGNKSWWKDDVYTDREGQAYTPDQIFETRGGKLKQYMDLLESCLVGDLPMKADTPEHIAKITELDRIMNHGQ